MKSNLAVLMDLTGIGSQALAVGVEADVSLISRWRTGGRKLVAGRHWAVSLAAFFLDQDARSGDPVIPRLLEAFYPAEDVDDPGEQRQLLMRWLTHASQFTDAYQMKRKKLLLECFSAPAPVPGEAPPQAAQERVDVYYGEDSAHEAILDMLDRLIELDRPMEGSFVCPEGLGLLTEDEAFSTQFMARLMKLYANGFRQKVVLRTDFKLSEVAFFSGPWLVAHLLGYVKSHYYDDFRKLGGIMMMAVFGDVVSAYVYGDKTHGLRLEMHYGADTARKVQDEVSPYFSQSIQRFRYDFFKDPGGFLAEARVPPRGDAYLFERLPHFGLDDGAVLHKLKLTGQEITTAKEQLWPFFETEAMLGAGRAVCHLFCQEDIETALDKPHHRVGEVSDLFGRRVHMNTQAFVEQLLAIRNLAQEYKNYQVCFLPERYFEQMVLQLGAWGNEAAIGWIPGGRSTACRDYTNVGALHGFCATIWNRIPGIVKSKAAANKKLSVWLKRAGKYGYALRGLEE